MRRFAGSILALAVLGCIAAAALHLGFDEPFDIAFVDGMYGAAALGVLLGLSLIMEGPVPDKRFKTGFKKNETKGIGGDRTYKLGSSITSEYGRYVKSLGDPVTGETKAE